MKNLLKHVNICHVGMVVGLGFIGHAIYKMKKNTKKINEELDEKIATAEEREKIVEALAETDPEQATLAEMQNSIDALNDKLEITTKRSNRNDRYIIEVCLGFSLLGVSSAMDYAYGGLSKLVEIVMNLTTSNTLMITSVGYDSGVIDKEEVKNILESLLEYPVTDEVKTAISGCLKGVVESC